MNKIIKGKAIDLSSEGKGVVKYHNDIIFVDGLFPDEEADSDFSAGCIEEVQALGKGFLSDIFRIRSLDVAVLVLLSHNLDGVEEFLVSEDITGFLQVVCNAVGEELCIAGD